MVINQQNQLLSSGGFADIFVIPGDDQVVKLYRRQEVTPNKTQEQADHDIVIRAVFDAEASAYEHLQTVSNLREFAPAYFGRIVVTDVLGANSATVASQYILDCAFTMERLVGEDTKIAMIYGSQSKTIGRLLTRFRAHGISYVLDTSCFLGSEPKPGKIIDFATWDAMASLSMELAEHGRLSDEVRARYAPR